MGEARQYEVRHHPAWSRSVNAEGRDGGWDFQAWHDTQSREIHHEWHQSSANATSRGSSIQSCLCLRTNKKPRGENISV